jgi:hypothetical protein
MHNIEEQTMDRWHMLKYEQDKGIKPTYQSVIHVPNPEIVNTKCYLNILLCILCQHLIFFYKIVVPHRPWSLFISVWFFVEPHRPWRLYLYQYDSL